MLLQEEREIVREYGIIMLEKNLTSGTSGNISVFNREKGLYAMTPTSMDYRKIKEEDIVIIDLDVYKRQTRLPERRRSHNNIHSIPGSSAYDP